MKTKLVLIGSGLLSLVIWWLVGSLPTDRFEVWFFDVGQGDSIYIHTPGDRRILIDGGPSNKVIYELDRRIPVWDRRIDILVATHLHADHISGIVEVIKSYEVGTVVVNPSEFTSSITDALMAEINLKSIPVRSMYVGDRIVLGAVVISAIWPETGYVSDDVNDSAITLLVTNNNHKLLLMSDVEFGNEFGSKLANDVGDIDVLKVPHQGSRGALTRSSLDVLKAEFAVIMVGENKYGHPASETINLLEEYGSIVYRTDTAGPVGFFDRNGKLLTITK